LLKEVGAGISQSIPLMLPAEGSAFEDSEFFGRTFDGVIAWGLMFLIPPRSSPLIIRQVPVRLNFGGRHKFVYLAPRAVKKNGATPD